MNKGNKLKIKISETSAHYIGLLGAYAILLLVILSSIFLVEQSVWFAEIWKSSTNRLIFIIGVPTAIIFILIYTHSYFLGHKKFIRNFKETEIFKLEKCKDNELIRIQGELILIGEPLCAPFSRKKCAAFETRVSTIEDVVTARGSGSGVESKQIWETLKLVSETSDFLIKCEKSYAIVRVEDCKLKIYEDIVHDEDSYKKDSGGFLSESENTMRQETLSRMNQHYRNYVGVYAKDIKFAEGVLEQGEQVAVRGAGKWIDIASSKELSFLYAKGIEKVFEMRNSTDFHLHISDSLDVLEKVVLIET